MAPPGPKFSEGERILCYHGPLMYEAKCLEFRESEKQSYEYWVHYAGWNKNWDEWVPETRILKYNDSNVAKQKDIKKNQKNVAPKKAKSGKMVGRPSGVKGADARSEGSSQDPDSRSSTPIDPTSRGRVSKKRESPALAVDGGDTPVTKRSKRAKQESSLKTEAQFESKVDIKVNFPDELKRWLVDDMVRITREKKLVALPAEPNVEKILEMYVQSKKGKGTTSVDRVCGDICEGLKEHFNLLLGPRLLFKLEEQQFAEISKKNADLLPTQIYGAHHLLRLFVRLGTGLDYSVLLEKTIALLLATVHDLMKYLVTNEALFFSGSNYA